MELHGVLDPGPKLLFIVQGLEQGVMYGLL